MAAQELDSRLLACVGFVRHGKVCADIGSDHAYLPIYLVKNGICPHAIASDINEGPVKRSEMNVRLSNLSDKITVMLADGLDKASTRLPDDIVIAGMGGELIRDIIDASEYVKNPDIRLILQPMTMPEVLREYLVSHGFDIVDECVCKASGKLYQIICAHFCGKIKRLNDFELLLGEKNISRMEKSPTDTDIEYLNSLINAASTRIDGRSKAKSPDTAAIERDMAIIKRAETIIESRNNY